MELQTNENETNEHVALNFETLKYDPSESSGDILLDNSCDPDLHFFNTNIQNLDTPYILPEEFQNFLDDDISESLSILHLNIRSIKKTSKLLKTFYLLRTIILALHVFLRHGFSMNFQVIIVYTKLDIIAKEWSLNIY